MKRPAPKADYLEHCWRFYCTLQRWGRGVGSGTFDATWRQLARACGYAPEAKVLHSLQAYAAILAELGLVRIEGVRDGAGRWQRLNVELLAHEPAAEARRQLTAPTEPEWRVRRLTKAEQRLLDEACQGSRAGRLPRRLAPRLQRIRNLRTPVGRGRGLRPLPLSGASAWARARRPAAARGGETRSGHEQGAHGAGCAGGACGGSPRPAAAGTPLGGVVSLDTVLSSLVRAAAFDLGALPGAAAVAVEQGADPAVAVQAVWRALHGAEGAHLSAERRRQLATALARLDRYAAMGAGQRGAGVALAVERIVSDRRPEPGDVVLHRLGGLAAWLDSIAAKWRRSSRQRAGARGPYTPKRLPDAARWHPTDGRWRWPADDNW